MTWQGSGEVVVGVALVVVWWIALRMLQTDKPLSTLKFALWPSLFILWLVGAIVLIANGAGWI